MTVDRVALRRALAAAYPWLTAADAGPNTVDAGTCERCGTLPRLLPTCGPAPWQALCRDCAAVVGQDGWCDGHAAEGAAARRWAQALPDEWATVVVLWWVATGEVRAGTGVAAGVEELPPAVRDQLRSRG